MQGILNALAGLLGGVINILMNKSYNISEIIIIIITSLLLSYSFTDVIYAIIRNWFPFIPDKESIHLGLAFFIGFFSFDTLLDLKNLFNEVYLYIKRKIKNLK